MGGQIFDQKVAGAYPLSYIWVGTSMRLKEFLFIMQQLCAIVKSQKFANSFLLAKELMSMMTGKGSR